ncbi:MAG TPA: SDR family oxidoreductase [Vicinamibacterales bacterium]
MRSFTSRVFPTIPSFELDPALGKSINDDAFFDLVAVARDSGVRRFIYASSSSVYGVKADENVTEEVALEPLTDYSKYKAMCEEVLLDAQAPGFAAVVVRPATVCGYSPRLRLDLTVNILTNHAVNNGRMTVFGGMQKLPNFHIDDMAEDHQPNPGGHRRSSCGRHPPEVRRPIEIERKHGDRLVASQRLEHLRLICH